MDQESIFAAALKIRDERERATFLDHACLGDAQLRAEVDGLLKAHTDAGSFLNHPPTRDELGKAAKLDVEETIETDVSQPTLSFLEPCNDPGRIGKLGIYEVFEIVGQGGMGIVLRACDTKLNRTVALKVMLPELATDSMAVKRFLSEARKAASIMHEHVVTIHAVDDVHRPPFLVMEYIEGQTLQQKIDREGALQVVQILRIGTQIAEGLAAAHKRGLIHRDIKPANILLENGVERVKITDFGLARAADDAKITQSGRVSGTPLYMSPEQSRGLTVDHRSDLFSFGSVLYTMCTGRPAFRADNHLAVMRRVSDDTPRPIQEVNQEIPGWLIEVIGRLLTKEPDSRFQSAAEVAEMLGKQLANAQATSTPQRPMPAGSPDRKEPKPTFLQTHRRKFLVLVFSVIVLVVAGTAVWKITRPDPPVKWSKADGGNGHEYLVVVEPRTVSWDQAHEKAQAMGGHLVTITSMAEEDFVVRLLNKDQYWYRAAETGYMRGPWIGAVQLKGAREPDGGWRWVTGEPFLYSDWKRGEPNDAPLHEPSQNRIFFHVEDVGWLAAQWGDADSRAVTRSFIVEFDGLSSSSPQSGVDPYASIVLLPSVSSLVNVALEMEPPPFARRFGDRTSTTFIDPGTYKWEVVDRSKDEPQLGRGSVVARGGQRIEFPPDGREPKLTGLTSKGNDVPPREGAVKWRSPEDGKVHWYLPVVDDKGISWDQAEQKAEQMGGHLATFTSRNEEDFVIRQLNDDRYWWSAALGGENKDGPWIGAFQLTGAREPDGGWRWITGEPFLYSNWQMSQPNDSQTAVQPQQYARFVVIGSDWLSAQWGDGSIAKRSFIVEWDGLSPRAPKDAAKDDPYGVFYVEPTAAEFEQMDITFFRQKDFVQRRRFGPSHTLFVTPGTYLCQWLMRREEEQVRRLNVEIKAGQRIAFTPVGLSAVRTSDGGKPEGVDGSKTSENVPRKE